ncbi:unnamed protein product [Notodromas monacha]|uniref:STAS domain-containing protein n=1 Tax=Notodromas monacha TaxID=399045 RepID=A0A7R9GAS7_9CRUS|nr:unnamed protein product [Notodromas monacha]CAG0914345.1 unnamed protein product [Notodromas monacha]
MAYAMLSGLPAVNGLYMAFFPVLVYIIFGSSKHNSIGTFAVVLLMTGTVSLELMEKHGSSHLHDYTITQTVALVTFAVGMWQMIMGLLRLGALSVLLSDVLVSGFTTGAAVHVLTSQLKGIFGITVPRQTRFPKLIRTHWYVLNHLKESNVVALIVSFVTMFILVINNDFVKPRLARRCSVPVPIELIAVVGGTLLSYLLNLNAEYKVPVIGEVPTGLPAPESPPLELLHDALAGSIVIAVVAYTTSYSMARIFARRLNYAIDANQELLALGLANIVGSFFQCGPVAASLSRSLIQESVGGATQIASIVSAGLIVIVLLFLGPLFEPLPRCILSSIIVVSLKGMFLQLRDLKQAWQSSKLDAMIWVATFLSVVIVDIDYGLAIGVAVSLITLLWRNQHAYACTLGEIPRTGIFVDSQRFDAADEIHNIKIFHYGAGLHFANGDHFREVLFDMTGLDPVKWHEQAIKRLKRAEKLRLQSRAPSAAVLTTSGDNSNGDSVAGSGGAAAAASAAAAANGEGHDTCCERCPLIWLNCCSFCKARTEKLDEASKGATEKFLKDSRVNFKDESVVSSTIRETFEDQQEGTNSSTEIRGIKIDRRSLSAGVSVGDCLALPGSTGLRLRRTSIHVDTTGHPLPFRYLLIDLSGIGFIDMAGVKLFKSLVQDYDRINIQVLFSGPTEPVLHMFRKMSFSDEVPQQRFFPTVQDAVMACKRKMLLSLVVLPIQSHKPVLHTVDEAVDDENSHNPDADGIVLD